MSNGAHAFTSFITMFSIGYREITFHRSDHDENCVERARPKNAI